ncbi:MAG TPA: DNA polymerase III subunit gamma/tau [Ktedonobacteraceae bacterium]|nr:DNA polymerase III subunit gamma/tau [Ktedonobacteraceae bacterium]
MTSQSLYRKWRSQTFDELVGQEEIVTTLKNALKSGSLAHAYLFTGPRGTGKTSTARLLAKTVNCLNPRDGEPCNECQQCREITAGNSFNVIEIDAASNRGIDSIRDLREKVMMPPSTGKYKVYVLDEAHMLTTEAFNALLKTLEEPPPYAIFILATTEVHKMLPTVISRCQPFYFKRITTRQIVEHLHFVAEQEHIKLERSAAELLARAAAGGMRDALSLLDQAIAYAGEEISLAQVQAMLGVADTRAISKLINHIAQQDSPAVLHLIHELAESGADLHQINAQVVEYWRALMLTHAGANTASILDLTEDEMSEIRPLSQLFSLEELTECARIFAQNDLMQKNQGTPQLGLELASLECIEVHRRAQAGQLHVAPAASIPTPAAQYRPPVSHTATQPEAPARLSQTPHARKPSTPQKKEEDFDVSPGGSARPPVTEQKEVQPVSLSSNGSKPPLTVEQVSDAWERVRKRTKQKSKSGLMAAYLEHFKVVGIEGTAQQPIVIIQAAKQVHYTFVKENDRYKDLEWALTMEFGLPCQVRLLPPGHTFTAVPVYEPDPPSANTMLTSAPPQSAYREPPVSSPPAQIEQAANGIETPDVGLSAVDTVHTNNGDGPVAKNSVVRENTSVFSSRESIQQQAERDPVVQEVIKTFSARIVDVFPK